MNHATVIASVIAIAASVAAIADKQASCADASTATAKTTVAATALLSDGSIVKGEFSTKSITGSTIFLEKLELDPALVKTIAFINTNGASKVELNNGDKFAMTVADGNFAIKSLLGDLCIPRTNFRSISLSAKKISSGGCDEGLVFYCTFDDETAITSPAVGPKGTICSREFVSGKVNGAVRVPVGSSAGFFNLPPETFGKEGCIEFWAKIEPRREVYRDCDPRMIFIKSPAGWFTVEYSSNNGGGRGGFCIRCFGFEYIKGGAFGSGYRYSDIIRDVAEWHHYAFSWTEDSLSVYIDGVKLVGTYKTGEGRIDEEKLKSAPSVMGLPNSNTNLYNTEPNSAFSIDELKIWNHPKQEFSLP